MTCAYDLCAVASTMSGVCIMCFCVGSVLMHMFRVCMSSACVRIASTMCGVCIVFVGIVLCLRWRVRIKVTLMPVYT